MLLKAGAAGFALAVVAIAQTQVPPVPKPFPGATQPSTPPASTSPAKPNEPTGTPLTAAPSPTAQTAPGQNPQLNGAPVYQGAEFLDTFNAGQGQHFYLYGTNVPFLDIVTYYKTTLRNGGSELSKAPGIQRFDLGKFDEQTMAFPPSIVVKDYAWNGSPGYLHVSGTTEKRFKTIIQIVPAGPGK